MKEAIIQYLSGPRPYQAGVDIYNTYGRNPMLKAAFQSKPESALLRETLFEELRKLAGLSEISFRLLKRQTYQQALDIAKPDTAPEALIILPTDKSTPVSPTVEKVIRFRERFPFLNQPDCPDVLKVLVSDMFTAHDIYVKSYRELTDMPDDTGAEIALSIAKTTVENLLKNQQMWAELEYYRDKGELKGEHPMIAAYLESKALLSKSDLEVEKLRTNASSNVSKWKKKLEQANTMEERLKATEILEQWRRKKYAAESILKDRQRS